MATLLPMTPQNRADLMLNPVGTLHNVVDDFFDTFSSQMGGFPMLGRQGLRRWREEGATVLRPLLDFEKTKDGYALTIDVPGVDMDDIDISCDGRNLQIAGEKKDENNETRDNWLISERQYGSWFRSIGLPEDADAKKITAKYHNGVLRVNIPQLAEAKKATRKIKVTKG